MRARSLACLGTVVLAALSAGSRVVSSRGQDPPRPQAPSTAFLDVVALDAGGRPVTSLRPEDLRVAIDGEPRRVVSLRYVFRGAGAEAAAKAAAANVGTTVAAEPSRLIFVIVDEDSFGFGAEKGVVSAVSQVADALAPADRVALATLPEPADVTAGSDRRQFREALGRVRGRAPTIDLSLTAAERLQAPDEVRSSDFEPSRDARKDASERTEPTRDRQLDPIGELSRAEAEQRDSTTRTRTSLEVLTDFLRSLRGVQGPKTVIYTWGGTWGGHPTDRGPAHDPARELDLVTSTAADARVVVHVVAVTKSGGKRPDPVLERLARETGGTLVMASAKGAPLERLAAAMTGQYVVEVEERAGDREGGVRSLDVSTTKKGTSVLAARRWTARDDPVPAPIAAAPAPTVTRDAVPAPAKPGSIPPRDAELEAVVARASEYLQSYLREFSSVVAEEEYTQTAVDSRPRSRQTGQLQMTRESVRLRSDLLLLLAGDTTDWIPFRDVFEVDGKPVRDREDRLRSLFLEKPDTAMQEGMRITRESSRYNVGRVERTVNTPTMGLFVLLPRHRQNLRFERHGEDTLEGVSVWRIDFEEVAGPTIIREAQTGKDLPSTGALWIDPTTGRVIKTLVRCGDTGFRMEMSTIFRRNDTLGIWAPSEMRESYWTYNGTYRITALARYAKFRRFQVTTNETVTVPKD